MAGESGASAAAENRTKTTKKKTRPIFRRVALSKPGPRVSGALGFPVPGGGFLLFGGYLEEGEGGNVRRAATNETWKLDKDLSGWERVQAPAPGVATAASPAAPPPPPSPRGRLAAAGAVASGSAWLLGGWDPGNKGDGGEILSDIWRYDLEGGSGWSEAKLRQPGAGAEEAEGTAAGKSERRAAATTATATEATAASAPFLPPPPETAVALPPGEDPSAFASLTAAAEQGELPESIVLPSLPACSRAAAAAIVGGGGAEADGGPKTIALFTHRNGGDILLLDTSDVSSPVLRACVVAGDEEAARKKGERAFDGSTALPASRGLSALASFVGGCSSSPSPSSSSLHLFGGAPKSGPMLDDSWFLELAPGWEARLRGGGGGGEEKEVGGEEGPTLRWSRQTSSSSSSVSPPPRCSHAVGVLSGESLYLFGGAYYDPAGLLPLGDLWRLDLRSREWEEVALADPSADPSSPSSSSPSPRNASAFGVVDLPGGKRGLLIHGGWDPFRKTHDDTWLLTEEEEEEAVE